MQRNKVNYPKKFSTQIIGFIYKYPYLIRIKDVVLLISFYFAFNDFPSFITFLFTTIFSVLVFVRAIAIIAYDRLEDKFIDLPPIIFYTIALSIVPFWIRSVYQYNIRNKYERTLDIVLNGLVALFIIMSLLF